MRRRFAMLALLLCAAPAAADTTDASVRAQQWLMLIDTAHYAEAWAQTDATLRDGLTPEVWSQRIRAARRTEGAARCRKAIAIEHLTDPSRIAALFVTEFADGRRIGEKVTLSATRTQIVDYRIGPAAPDRGAPCTAATTPEPLR
jgi:hypothetical protein